MVSHYAFPTFTEHESNALHITIRFVLPLSLLVLISGLIFTGTVSTSFAQKSQTPTYYHDVAPIIAANCLSCHVEGGIAPFALDTEDAVIKYVNDIKDAVATRYMPPWMPDKQSPAIVGDRSLADADIKTIVDWAGSGAPVGDATPSTESVTSLPSGLTLRRDLVLSMPATYTPKAGKNEQDDYRCFVMETGLTTDRFITGYTLEAGQPSEVHHVIVYQMDKGALDQARAKDALDTELGYTCFGGTGLKISGGGDGGTGLANSLGSWTPGGLPVLFPANTGRLLTADSFLVVQIHYNFANGAKADQSRLVLQFAPEGAKLAAVRGLVLIAPVEIPCPQAAASDPNCNRQTQYDLNVKEDGRASVLGRTDLLLRHCGKTTSDYLMQEASHVVSTCISTVPIAVTAIGVNAHMHNRGKSFRIELNPGTANAKILLNVPQWDFHWQGSYIFVKGIPLAKGDTLKVTCEWDNSHDKQPRYILWGETTNDEMCLGSVTYIPR